MKNWLKALALIFVSVCGLCACDIEAGTSEMTLTDSAEHIEETSVADTTQEQTEEIVTTTTEAATTTLLTTAEPATTTIAVDATAPPFSLLDIPSYSGDPYEPRL